VSGEHTDDTPMTPEGLEALRREVEQMKTVGRREIAARIKTAREWGDLKENAEYHDAKNSQALLERRITVLDSTLRRAVPVESTGTGDTIAFGSTAHVTDEATSRAASYTIVGATEGNAAEGRLSVDSPIARALMGARAGDVVEVTTPGGVRRLRVDSLGA
jgi:transcription elongation factor GreA